MGSSSSRLPKHKLVVCAEAFGLLLEKPVRPLNMFRQSYGKNSRNKIKGWEKIE